jgi:hypothetical protein
MRNSGLENGLSATAAAAYATNNFGPDLGYNAYGVDSPVGLDGKLTASPIWDTDWKSLLMDDTASFDEFGINL